MGVPARRDGGVWFGFWARKGVPCRKLTCGRRGLDNRVTARAGRCRVNPRAPSMGPMLVLVRPRSSVTLWHRQKASANDSKTTGKQGSNRHPLLAFCKRRFFYKGPVVELFS